MIELNELLIVLDSADVADSLDTLVQRELSQGREPDAIFDDIRLVMPKVIQSPQYTSDVDEVFHGITDGLRGWCHPSQRYSSRTTSVSVSDREAIQSLLAKLGPQLLQQTIHELTSTNSQQPVSV
jgi:hypothetical protein